MCFGPQPDPSSLASLKHQFTQRIVVFPLALGLENSLLAAAAAQINILNREALSEKRYLSRIRFRKQISLYKP